MRALILPVLLVVTVVSAAAQSWVTNETPPSPITTFAVTSDDIVIAGGGLNGIYRSVDKGNTWEWQISGKIIPFDFDITALAVGANDHIYASVKGRGVYVSRDKGLTWDTVNGMLPSKVAVAIAAKPLPNGKTRLLAGMHDPSLGLFLSLSDDDGDTWTSIPVPNSSVQSIIETALSPNSDKLFVSVGYNKGLYRSKNMGQSWIRIDDSNFSESDDNFRTIRFNKQGHMYVGRNNLEASTIIKNAVIIRSTDDGETWTYLKNGWHAEDVTNNRVMGIAFGVGNEVLATTAQYGTWYSPDAGDTWQRADDGIAGNSGTGLAMTNLSDGTVLLAPTGVFIYRWNGLSSSVMETRPLATGPIVPNPATGDAVVTMVLDHPSTVDIMVLDQTGQAVQSTTVMAPVGEQRLRIAASEFANGQYTVVLTAGGRRAVHRMTVLH